MIDELCKLSIKKNIFKNILLKIKLVNINDHYSSFYYECRLNKNLYDIETGNRVYLLEERK